MNVFEINNKMRNEISFDLLKTLQLFQKSGESKIITLSNVIQTYIKKYPNLNEDLVKRIVNSKPGLGILGDLIVLLPLFNEIFVPCPNCKNLIDFDDLTFFCKTCKAWKIHRDWLMLKCEKCNTFTHSIFCPYCKKEFSEEHIVTDEFLCRLNVFGRWIGNNLGEYLKNRSTIMIDSNIKNEISFKVFQTLRHNKNKGELIAIPISDILQSYKEKYPILTEAEVIDIISSKAGILIKKNNVVLDPKYKDFYKRCNICNKLIDVDDLSFFCKKCGTLHNHRDTFMLKCDDCGLETQEIICPNCNYEFLKADIYANTYIPKKQYSTYIIKYFEICNINTVNECEAERALKILSGEDKFEFNSTFKLKTWMVIDVSITRDFSGHVYGFLLPLSIKEINHILINNNFGMKQVIEHSLGTLTFHFSKGSFKEIEVYDKKNNIKSIINR